jgi:hypothetical protein
MQDAVGSILCVITNYITEAPYCILGYFPLDLASSELLVILYEGLGKLLGLVTDDT